MGKSELQHLLDLDGIAIKGVNRVTFVARGTVVGREEEV
jgi:hypothetical protein